MNATFPDQRSSRFLNFRDVPFKTAKFVGTIFVKDDVLKTSYWNQYYTKHILNNKICLIVSNIDERLQKTLITKFSMALPGFFVPWLELKNTIKKFLNFIRTQNVHSVEYAIYFKKL